jgi:hypothetical protein
MLSNISVSKYVPEGEIEGPDFEPKQFNIYEASQKFKED